LDRFPAVPLEDVRVRRRRPGGGTPAGTTPRPALALGVVAVHAFRLFGGGSNRASGRKSNAGFLPAVMVAFRRTLGRPAGQGFSSSRAGLFLLRPVEEFDRSKGNPARRLRQVEGWGYAFCAKQFGGIAMKEAQVTLPELALIGGTRVALG